MNTEKVISALLVICLLLIAASIITIASVTLISETKTTPDIKNPDIVNVEILDDTIKINILGDKYKTLSSYSVETNKGVIDIKYDGSVSKIPFSNDIATIKITGHFSDGTEDVLFSGNVTPGVVAEPINPGDIKFTVTFVTNGGSEILPQIVSLNEKIKTAVSEKSGYALEGWYVDSALTKPYDFSSFVMTDLTLYAKWSEDHTVRFDSNGGFSTPKSQTVIHGDYAIEPKNPIKVGDKFAGWYSDRSLSDEWDFDSDAVTRDITLYAKWAYENGDYSLSSDDFAYKNQYESVERFVSSVNKWYSKDALVMKNYKIVSFNGVKPISLPLIPNRNPAMIKTSPVMTIALNSAESFDVSDSCSQIYIADGGKIIINGALVFVVDRGSYNPDTELIEIEDGGELVAGEKSEIIVRVVNNL